MPNYLHRATKAYQISVSPASLSEPESSYIKDPDVSSVAGFETRYWVIAGDIVSLMSGSARAAVDAVALENSRDNAMTSQVDDTESVLRAFATVVMNELNVLREQHELPDRTFVQLRTAMRNELGI